MSEEGSQKKNGTRSTLMVDDEMKQEEKESEKEEMREERKMAVGLNRRNEMSNKRKK